MAAIEDTYRRQLHAMRCFVLSFVKGGFVKREGQKEEEEGEGERKMFTLSSVEMK